MGKTNAEFITKDFFITECVNSGRNDYRFGSFGAEVGRQAMGICIANCEVDILVFLHFEFSSAHFGLGF